MQERRVARRYAKALVEATGANNIAQLEKDIVLAQDLWNSSPLIRAWFMNPSVKKNERVKKVELILKDYNFSKTMKNFFLLLAAKNRLNLIPEIIEITRELIDDVMNRVRADFITARDVKRETIDTLKIALQEKIKKEVLFNIRKDEKILGGVILNIKGTIFDGSLITRLNRLKEKLKEEGNGIAG